MDKKALIIMPVGTGLFFDDAYDKENHWRYTDKLERSYETLAVVFKDDYEPEPNTYDHITYMKGRKWNLIPEVAKNIDLSNYDYIGCWDDDYTTDIQSVNEALEIARMFDFRLFQQSAISFNSYNCLKHNPDLFYSETDFIELGVPFFRNDIFARVLEFLNDYKYEVSDWGIDKVLCYYLNDTANVVHCNTIKHMRPDESSYDKSDGFREMAYLMREFFPKYMKEKFNRDYVYNDSQNTIRSWRLGDDS